MKSIVFRTLVPIAGVMLLPQAALAGGKNEQATAAIAAAQAKIDAANKVGASGEVPRLSASAEASLRDAKLQLSRGHKDEAISAANNAAELADQALGEAQKAKDTAAAAQQNQAAMTANDAQAAAADANARAAAAQQAATSAAQDAAAARAATPVVAVVNPTPPAEPAATTVTTETTAAAPKPTATRSHRVVRHTVRHSPRTSANGVAVKTTTTVASH